MADERKGFLLRLPPQLLAEVRSWAEQDLRSLNAQIEWLLREALRRRRGGVRGDDAVAPTSRAAGEPRTPET
ncbi:MAG: Arc family DNA-binding protein [Planctomycetes bacterium]|nr:Arc family DNA-binding protein [Planctomycetota bacterium]